VVFAALGWGLGPHWAVAGACVLAATLVPLVAIEHDGLAAPLSVAVVGTVLAAGLLEAAGVADRRWTHVVGVGVGVAVAGAVLAVIRWRRANEDDPSPWWASAPILLPVGVALGWLGPVYAGEGLGTAVVVLLVAHGTRHGHPDSDRPRSVMGLALAAGAVVATVIAVSVGAGVGR
jgi:hypothetical protein